MDSDLIDLIYQNEAVEGVAIFDANNQLVENQLSLSLSKVEAIATTLYKLKNGLTDAGRELRGFVIKSGALLLLVCMSPENLILLEISEGASVNEVDSNLRSIIGTTASQPQAAQPATVQPLASQPIQQAQPAHPAHPVLPAATLPPAQTVEGDNIDLADFKMNLSKLIKTVAPGKLADSMISSTMKDMGIDENAVHLPQQQATQLGYSVIERIPNKARRQIIKNEYTTMLNQ